MSVSTDDRPQDAPPDQQAAEAPSWDLVRERARPADTAVALTATVLVLSCLVPLFNDLAWVLPAVTMALVVSGAGLASRAIALPVPFVPIVQFITIIGMLTAMFVVDTAWARLLPTAESAQALARLASMGLQDSQVLAAPVPTEPQLILLAVGGAALTALCLDSLFVSLRMPMLAGIPIAVVYAGSTFLLFGRGPWWPFIPAAIAWLLILAADQRARIRDWSGVPVTTRVRGLSTTARRVGGIAILLALVAGTWIPVRAFDPLGGTGSGPAGSAVAQTPILLDPLVSMRRNLTLATDSQVLRYRTDSPAPSYLRVTALENFDGQTWRPRAGLETGRDPGWDLPAIVAEPATRTTSTYEFDVTNLSNSYLPLPYPIASLESVAGVATGWRLDPATGVAFSDGEPATGSRYRVTALESTVDREELRDSPSALGTAWPQLNLPGGMNPVIKQTALEVTADAETPYDKALALQKWFTSDGGFRYSTSVRSGAGADYIAEFLEDRVGYCEQYAGAMAVMARQLGIPSRVVVGFTQGAPVEDDLWEVTVRDAHAWPELWFEGVGWVRFEPTPRTDATVQAPEYAPATPSETSPDETRGQLDEEGFDPVTGAPVEDPSSLPRMLLVISLALTIVIALLPMLRRIARRRMRLGTRDPDRAVLSAWAEVEATAIDLGQPWSAFDTARQAADRLGRGMPEAAAQALARVRSAVEQVRYAPRRTVEAEAAARDRAAAVRADARIVIRELTRRVRWQVRIAAYCWPSSERRRQRSSMRSMSPDLRSFGAAAGASASSTATEPRFWNAE